MDRVRDLFLVVKRNEALTLSIILALAILIIRYPNVAEWNLGDNDNFMRLHQIKTFIDTPSWYLHPLKDFNPQDGQIIHWSRIPDLPILAAYYVTYLFLDETTAMQIAITIVPLIYLILLSLVLCKITKSIFELNQPVLATTYTFFSVASLKFLPGHIDHHNLQILLFAVFILLTFSKDFDNKLNLSASALCIAISLSIGLEALPFYILTLGCLALYALYCDLHKLTYIRNLSFLTFLFGALIVAIFQKPSVWFHPQYDVLTFPLLCFFLSASASLEFTLLRPKLITLLISATIIIGVTWMIFPDVLKSPYANYPEVLVIYWLNHVSEARPLVTILSEESNLPSNWLYIVTIIPAIFSIFFLSSFKTRIYYLVFLISLTPAVFWQIRTILFSSMLSVPLITIIGKELFHKINIPIVRVIIPLLLAPILTAGAISFVTKSETNNTFRNNNKKNETIFETINTLNIKNKKIFASLDQSTRIIALTNNMIITAPYHRNIRGNKFYIESMLSIADENLHLNFQSEKVDFLVFDRKDTQIKYIKKEAKGNSLLTLLLESKPPPWLSLIKENDKDTYIYAIK